MKRAHMNFAKLIFKGVIAAFLLTACQTTDTLPTDTEPTLQQLYSLKVVEEFPADGGLTAKRHASGPEGRFALSVSELDGTERERAFSVAEQAYGRICGGSSPDNSGVGKLGSRAPYYSSELRTYYIYMQCANGSVGG